ncbi:polysaccharide ABC transporter ATP-binding protein [Marinobacter salicampi]|uniref:ABC transporter ATP-binding protein n=1 Tax=Marinobacter salicampi TaxID=435907 RepID=UPI00140E2B3A|nr:polysaccharide ABC transporter ATP-binding protein [Marinobacter salicampi]
MSDIAIRVENLGKAYRLGSETEQAETFVEAGLNLIKAPLRNFRKLRNLDTFSTDRSADDILWALDDVSFDIRRGEVVGFVGRNGAGKSTLLKVLSRITEPTTGRIEIHGRVSSLLEVGTGFHPELTGRENIYMNGTILGMKKAEIDRKFNEIVEFSGVERFLDTPVKRYSSGMKVRLAFSVAAHLEPEILIIDEVLAVGDAEFQKKCLGKMEEVAGSGRTVLFVSHNMAAIQNLCGRAISLKAGLVVDDGPTKTVIEDYLARFKSEATSGFHNNADRKILSSTQVTDGRMLNSKGVATQAPCAGEPTIFELDYKTSEKSVDAIFDIVIANQHNVAVTQMRTEPPIQLGKEGTVRLTLEDTPLPIGKYTATVTVKDARSFKNIDKVPSAFSFEVFILKDFFHLERVNTQYCSTLSRQKVEHITERQEEQIEEANPAN